MRVKIWLQRGIPFRPMRWDYGVRLYYMTISYFYSSKRVSVFEKGSIVSIYVYSVICKRRGSLDLCSLLIANI